MKVKNLLRGAAFAALLAVTSFAFVAKNLVEGPILLNDVEKCVTVNYGKGGCNYDSEGTARNVDVAITGVAARQVEQPIYLPDPNLLPGNANEVEADGPTGEEGAGYIWDAVLKAHGTVRDYGFYTDLGALDVREDLGLISPTLAYPCSTKPPTQVEWSAKKELLKLTDPCFWPFDQSYPDFFRFMEWQREFKQQVKANKFPTLTLLRYDHDHFGNFGTASFGVNTPEYQMADDDYAVGLTDDVIAHSPYANSTLIFVIEDDPQDGADTSAATAVLRSSLDLTWRRARLSPTLTPRSVCSGRSKKSWVCPN
ncbi:MAG: hypothetical protein WCB11_14800 [Terriglobales bacterium]